MPKPKALADLLNELFHTVRHPSGREFTHIEVIEHVSQLTDGELILDPSSLGKLRAGLVKNPGVKMIEALSLFFGVDTDYFFPNLARRRGDGFHRADVADIQLALCARGIDPSLREHLVAIINALTIQKKC